MYTRCQHPDTLDEILPVKGGICLKSEEQFKTLQMKYERKISFGSGFHSGHHSDTEYTHSSMIFKIYSQKIDFDFLERRPF